MNSKKVRHHGFQRPFHHYQVISWAYVFLSIIHYYNFLYPFVDETSYEYLALVFDISILSEIFFGLIATRIDPTDSIVKKYWEDKNK
jgi:hypothetical protein